MRFHSLEHFGLGRALAISIAFHVLLLWPIGATRQEAPRTGLIEATLRAPHDIAALRPLVQGPKRPQPQDRRQPAIATPATPAIPLPPARVEAVAKSPDSTADAGGRSRTAAVAAAESQPVAYGLDVEGVRTYRLALARQARGQRRYPERASIEGWSGTTEVRIAVARGGIPQAPILVRSSGYAILDQAALEMLGKAVRSTPVPESLRRQAFDVDLPVVFELPE